MDVLTNVGAIARVVLAHEKPFTVGGLRVDPAMRQVSSGGPEETLEPRVMQVLVALAAAEGKVVSRDELVDRCWDGRIVGENAINRVISRLRIVAAGIGSGTFEIQTITKVGYRITVTGVGAGRVEKDTAGEDGAEEERAGEDGSGEQQPGLVQGARELASEPALIGRRPLVALALVLAGGGAAFLWNRSSRQVQSPADMLYAKAVEAQRQGLADQTAQAINFLEEAVKLDPGLAKAWGALALSYRHRLENDPTADQARLAQWIVSAADRSLELDPGNADAHVAKMLISPDFRNWITLDPRYRAALAQYPDHWLLRGTFGRMLYGVGRWREGIEAFRANIAKDAFLPLSRYFLAHGLWNSGRLQEADAAMNEALERWPNHPALWFQRSDFLAYSGRTAEALAFLGNASNRPHGVPIERFGAMAVTARALGGGGPKDVNAAIAAARAAGRRDASSIPRVAQELARLGRPDDVFALLDSYYLGKPLAEGLVAGAIGPLTRRSTDFLFAQPLAALRSDPRFLVLLNEIGLEGYWRATGSEPDYRRFAGG